MTDVMEKVFHAHGKEIVENYVKGLNLDWALIHITKGKRQGDYTYLDHWVEQKKNGKYKAYVKLKTLYTEKVEVFDVMKSEMMTAQILPNIFL